MAEVVAARKRIELQTRQVRPAVARLEERARTALQNDRQDAARDALTWRNGLQAELDELDRQTASLAGEEARLREAASRLDLQLQQLRLRREALRAGGAAAHAGVEAREALAAVRLGDSDLQLAVQEAQRRIASTGAMADALQGRAARRALQAATAAGTGPSAGRRSAAEVAEEMARMEEELLWGPEAREERRREERG